MDVVDNSKILETVLQYCIVKEDRKYLTCEMAFKIAQEMEVNVTNIGILCNKNDIKIKSCQIGCF